MSWDNLAKQSDNFYKLSGALAQSAGDDSFGEAIGIGASALQYASIGTALGGGPVGAGAGLAIGAGFGLINRSRRRRQIEEARQRRAEEIRRQQEAVWQRGLDQYKSGLSNIQSNMDKARKAAEMALGKRIDVFSKSLGDMRLGLNTKGLSFRTQTRVRDESAERVLEQQEEALLSKIAFVAEASRLIELEKNAKRKKLGKLKTDIFNEAKRVSLRGERY